MDGVDLGVKIKDSTLLIKVNKEEKKKFIALCALNDTSASREIRGYMKEYISKFSVEIKLDND
jgi:hypothetical protein